MISATTLILNGSTNSYHVTNTTAFIYMACVDVSQSICTTGYIQKKFSLCSSFLNLGNSNERKSDCNGVTENADNWGVFE